MRFATLCVLALASSTNAALFDTHNAVAASVNPIRKVVTMLQMMVKKVTLEGEKEKELYEKYMCYCKGGSSSLSKSIGDANTKIPEVQSDIEEADVKKAQGDRAAAKAAQAEATAQREKEAATFAALKAEQDSDISAMMKAVKALENGMA